MQTAWQPFVVGSLILVGISIIVLPLWLVWKFLSSAVRAGVSSAAPVTPPAAPIAAPPVARAGITEADVRRIVREELRAVQAAAAARRAGSPGATPPGSSRAPSR